MEKRLSTIFKPTHAPQARPCPIPKAGGAAASKAALRRGEDRSQRSQASYWSPFLMKNSRSYAIMSVFVSVLMLSSNGCNLSSEKTASLMSKVALPGKKTDDRPKMGPTKVIADATALALDLPESDLQAREKFRQRFSKLISDGRLAAADISVARHPDHAYDVLTKHFNRQDEAIVVLAASYDRFCGGSSGWHTMLTGASSESVDQYFFNRTQFLGTITNGQFDSLQGIDLVSHANATGQEALVVDAWYQTGIARMLQQDNASAAEAFASAAEAAGDRHGMQGAVASLMGSEARRRSGAYAAAITTWQESVERACHLIRTRNVTDPNYWDRATYLQPLGTAWPTSVTTTFAAVGQSTASAIRTDLLRQLAMSDEAAISSACWIEAAMGSWREARGESQKALVHLKKAETMSDAKVADWLRIAQAPILVSLGQQGTATTVLAPLIAREDNSPVMLAAMSKLGVMKLTGGSQQHGIRLLHEAVVDSPDVDWPGKASARADFALGLLMIGETSEGLNQLRQAQQQFQAEGEIEQLAQSLWNEHQFLEHTQAEKTEIASVQNRLKTMQL